MSNEVNDGKHGSALDKALAVLEAVVDQSQPIGLPDLTTRLGLPRQTIHRILQQLEGNRLITRAPGRDRFSVGPRLQRLSLNALASANHNAPVRAVLQDLVNQIQETCNIGVLDGLDLLYLERVESDWSLRVHLQAGSQVPAYCTSGGKVLLAYLPAKLRRRLLQSRQIVAHTENTITDLDALEVELAAVREMGYSRNNEEFTKGVVGIGVPILDASGQAVAALACHAPAARLSLSELTAHVAKLQDQAGLLSEVWHWNQRPEIT